jgi:hypothetical protein
MELSSPIDAVASAVHHAAHVALPDFHYLARDFDAWRHMDPKLAEEARRNNTIPEKEVVRRPRPDECEVHAMFAQTWGSTSLGFGGIGGAAMTPAYTVVISGPGGHFAVYWAGRLAYVIDSEKQTPKQRQLFIDDLGNRWTKNVLEAVVQYGAIERRRG